MVVPLVAERALSQAAVEAALSTEDKTIVVVTQRASAADPPGFSDLFEIGTESVIKKMARTDELFQIIVQGVKRVRLIKSVQESPYYRAKVEPLSVPDDWKPQTQALYREVLEVATNILKQINPEAEPALQRMVSEVKSPLHQVYLISTLLTLTQNQEENLLAAESQHTALEAMHDYLRHETQILELRQDINNQVRSEMNREQREYVLRKQLQTIQEELGEQSPQDSEIQALRKTLNEIELPTQASIAVNRELDRLQRVNTAAPDYQASRTCLEMISELPWTRVTKDNLDLTRARSILDSDHYDLENIKNRIVEHLAVRKLNPKAKAPILCFLGPPGVGKTSLGKSIARSLGRKFVRISLGGLSDAAELRGHRRTFIGAIPGRIIQTIRRAKVRNPVFMLDEIDKLGHDFCGEPASALLEILDPDQNFEFQDNYLNLPFDLSQVMFVAAANAVESIPRSLLDRIEILQLSGYTDSEKRAIARRYLLPRLIEQAGLAEQQIEMSDEIISLVVRNYTREAGVRELEHVLGRICRKVATRVAIGITECTRIASPELKEWLGPAVFCVQDARKRPPSGVAAGLAWTPVGGEVVYIEAVLLPDQTQLTLTGHPGAVMKESARTAQSLVTSQWAELNLDKQALNSGVHIHVPARATPKDGPSAGATIATALASLYTDMPVRPDTAVTGEITLSGLVLPVAGIKEKVLAAQRAGFRHIVMARQNEKDLADLSEEVRSQMQFSFAMSIHDVISACIPQLGSRLAHV